MKLPKLLAGYVMRYFMGFLVVFMGSILVAWAAGKSIETYVMDQAVMRNQEGINAIGNMVSKMDLINRMMSHNREFTSVVYQKGKIPPKDVLRLRKANRMVGEIGFAADYVPYLFTLFRSNDLYLSTDQCSFRFQDYYGKFLNVSANGVDLSSPEGLRSFLFERYAAQDPFVKTDSVTYIYDGKKHILDQALLYVTGNGYPGTGTMYVSCFVMNQKDIIENIMMPELIGGGFLQIRDQKTGDVLLGYGDVPRGVEGFTSGQTVEDGRYRVIVTTQKDLNWDIVTGVPMSFIEAQMKPVYHLLAAYLAIGLALVIGLTLYYSLNRYSGIKRVMFALPLHGGQETEKRRTGKGWPARFNEYRLITDHILSLKKSGNDYRIRMEQLAGQNEAMLLEHLMTMGIRTPMERSAFEKCFEREPEFFCTVVVRLPGRAFRDSESISLTMVEFLQKRFRGKFTNVYSGVTDELFLFELIPEQEANVQGLSLLFEEITGLLTQEYDVIFHVGLSAIGTDISNIHKCCEQARQVVQAQYARSNENVVECYDISLNGMYENPVNLEFLNRLYTLLSCGQHEEAEEMFERLESIYDRMPCLYEIQKEQIWYSIRGALHSAWLNLNCDTEFAAVLPSYDATLTCQAMIEAFGGVMERMNEVMNQSKKSKNEELKQRIVGYLESGFQNAGLSAYTVSREMGISEKYLSQFIREQTGETFSAYLLRLRLDKAKEYLRTTDLSNDKIAELTGFGAVATFYRNFKEQTGVTPKLYKENNRIKSE